MIRKLLIAFPIIISLMLAGCFGETSIKQYRIGHVETAKTVKPPAEKPAKKKEKVKKVKKKRKSRKEKAKITAAKRKKKEKKTKAVVSKPQVTEKKTEASAKPKETETKAETTAALQIERYRLNEMEKTVEALRRTVNLQQERNQQLEERLGTIQSQGTGKAETTGASTLERYRIKEMEETIEVLRNMVNLQQERIQLLEKRLGTIRRRR